MKPDQLIKRRGKLGLLKVNATIDEVKAWVLMKMTEETKVSCHKYISCQLFYF